MKKVSDILFISLFLLVLLVPSLGMLLGFQSGAAANEILAPAPKPGLTMLNETADYVADRFAFRQELVSAWSWLNEKLLRTSAEEQVMLGSDGWLYYSETLDDYSGRAMSDAELDRAARNLLTLQEYLESEGVDFLFTIAPNKNSLYPEHMPKGIPHDHENGNAARLKPYLERYGVHYADLFTPLAGEVLYYRTDTHWTAQGAAIGADTLLAALGRRSDYAAGPFGTEGLHVGDLYDMLYPTGKGREAEQIYLPGFHYEAPGGTGGGNAFTIETVRPGAEGKLLCWRDSFGIALFPYLAESYGEATFTRRPSYDLTWYAGEGYDTVIIELVERNLPQLLNEPVLPQV